MLPSYALRPTRQLRKMTRIDVAMNGEGFNDTSAALVAHSPFTAKISRVSSPVKIGGLRDGQTYAYIDKLSMTTGMYAVPDRIRQHIRGTQ